MLPILPVSELQVQSLTVESEDAEATSNWEEDRDMASTAHTGPECPEHTAHAVNCSRWWTTHFLFHYYNYLTFAIIHLQTNIPGDHKFEVCNWKSRVISVLQFLLGFYCADFCHFIDQDGSECDKQSDNFSNPLLKLLVVSFSTGNNDITPLRIWPNCTKPIKLGKQLVTKF